ARPVSCNVPQCGPDGPERIRGTVHAGVGQRRFVHSRSAVRLRRGLWVGAVLMVWHDDYRVWLTESQSLDTAHMIVDHLLGNSGWNREAICALVGNMRIESSINPNMYEYGYDWSADRGFGLVQWTPRSKYWDWATARGLAPREGDSQLDRITYEVDQNIQWIPISDYGGMTFADFRANTGGWSIDYLTEAFTWSYERPAQSAGESSMPDRKAF